MVPGQLVQRDLLEWFVLLGLILGAAQVAMGGRCKAESLHFHQFGKKKGLQWLSCASVRLTWPIPLTRSCVSAELAKVRN